MSLDRRSVLRSLTAAVVAGLLLAVSVGAPVAGRGRLSGTVLLSDARSEHTATLLPDDYVLLAGGSDGLVELTSGPELMDPVGIRSNRSARWRSRDRAALPPCSWAARVLVAGGQTEGSSLVDAELLDPISGLSEPTGRLNWARAKHDAALLPDGRVLLIGGVDGGKPIPRAELFDPASGTFEPAAKSKAVLLDPVVTVLPSGAVLVTGTSTKKKGASAQPYDPLKNQWSALKKAPKLARHASTLLLDGRVLLAGGTGDRSQLFDPANEGVRTLW